MSNLASVWPEVKYLLSDNISLIPVRDKDETDDKGNFRPAKTPFTAWTTQQSTCMTESQLWSSMDKNHTMAVAIVCGKVSGGIEVIDVDVKYKPGVDALLLKDIQTLYPDLYARLRIHRTPSKGCHLIYRITDHEVPGNVKLAGRAATEEEIQQQLVAGRKRVNKEMNFLETRGEGGYILAPPSMDYAIVQDNPIPNLTWEERSSLIALCHTYTEIIKPPVPAKPSRTQEDQYSTNPFEDYNLNGDLLTLLEENDWQLLSENADRYMFTRPGKDQGVSATWHKENRCFYVFTSSTEFEPGRGYNPSTVMAMLLFKNDKSQTYKHLTHNGFGIFKPYVEENIVRRCVLSTKELPNNVSPAAKEKFQTLKEQYNSELPFGRFWEFNLKSESFQISREDLYRVAHEIGYRLHNKTQIIRINGQLLEKQNDKDFYNAIKKYIWEEDAQTYTQICNSFEAFIQKSGNFTITRLQDIDPQTVLKDGPTFSYKYFSNGVLEITATSTDLLPYDNFEQYVWAHNIKPREWDAKVPLRNLYANYLENAIGITPYLKKVIGYLAHDYKSESSAYLITLTEKVIDPKDGGGSGKNIFGNILSGTTTIKTVPGSSVKFDDKFFAAWNRERIYFLADIPKKIDWLFLKEMVGGVGYVNKKFVAEYDVPTEEMPKLLLNTNYSYDDVDGGLKRRIRQVEFTNYYTLNGGVDTVHGKMFPGEFTAYDWMGYDHFIVQSLQELFRSNGKIELIPLSQEGWTKKFNIKHHDTTLEFIQDNIEQWCETGFVPNHDFKEQYSAFAHENSIPPKYRKEAANLTAALKEYCQHYEIRLDANKVKRAADGPVKGKEFGDYTPNEIY